MEVILKEIYCRINRKIKEEKKNKTFNNVLKKKKGTK